MMTTSKQLLFLLGVAAAIQTATCFLVPAHLQAQLAATPSLRRSPLSQRRTGTLAPVKMQSEDDADMSRRSVMQILGLAPLALMGSSLVSANPKPAQALLPIEESLIETFQQAVPSVCFISTQYGSMSPTPNMDVANPGGPAPKGVGSGFVWDKQGHIVTNFHVINKVDNAIVTLTSATGEVKEYTAKLTGVDPDKDIAVLKIDAPAENLQPVQVGSAKGLRVGQYALAIGNPFGQDHTFTTGVISGKNREITSPTGRQILGVLQTDAAINPGNSGGPLYDSAGRVVGMNTATIGADGVNAGVSFAVPIDTVRDIVAQLIEFGQVSRAVLGVSYLQRLPTPEESKQSGIPLVERGVVVLDVPSNSPCFPAGMKAVVRSDDPKVMPVIGDVIVGINEYPIDSPASLAPVLEKFKPGEVVSVKVRRGPQQTSETLKVTLGAFKGSTFSKLASERG